MLYKQMFTQTFTRLLNSSIMSKVTKKAAREQAPPRPMSEFFRNTCQYATARMPARSSCSSNCSRQI